MKSCITTLEHIPWNPSFAKDRERVLSGQLCTGGVNRNPGDSIDPKNQVRYPVVAPLHLCKKLSSYQLILLPSTNIEIPLPVFFDTTIFVCPFC